MRILALATQTCEDDNYLNVWGIDLITKMTLKIHMDKENISQLRSGSVFEINSILKCHRQELWISEIEKIENSIEEVLPYLEKKASTPYAINGENFGGNIVKVEEVVSVEKDLIKASVYGFPKEIMYFKVEDAKWTSYFKNNLLTSDEHGWILRAFNKITHKYFVIDFPNENERGLLKIAAVIVR